MKPSQLCIDIVKHFESLHDGDLKVIGLQPKMCPAGIWTVGYGRALTDKTGRFLRGEKDKAQAYSMYPNLTVKQAEEMLHEDLDVRAKVVDKIFSDQKITLLQHQFDAMLSFAYNCGPGAIYDRVNNRDMAIMRAIKSKNEKQVTAAFLLWVKANGKTLPGLVLRRKSEAILFNTGTVKI